MLLTTFALESRRASHVCLRESFLKPVSLRNTLPFLTNYSNWHFLNTKENSGGGGNHSPTRSFLFDGFFLLHLHNHPRLSKSHIFYTTSHASLCKRAAFSKALISHKFLSLTYSTTACGKRCSHTSIAPAHSVTKRFYTLYTVPHM